MFSSRTDWPLTPNRLSRLLEERRRQGLPVLDLTESNPTHCGFNFDAEKLLSALADPRSLAYEPDPRGLLAARRAVAGYYAERGIQLVPEQIFLTSSTSEAYSYVLRLLANPGESILVPRPSYPLFDFLAGLNDVNLIWYSLAYHDGWRIERHSLAAALAPGVERVRAIIVVHPNNPTGSFVDREELEVLLKYCQEHTLALVADEVFADYAFAPEERRVTSHAGVSEALTFTLSGLSKISALPQMKLAWVVVNGPPDVLPKALARLEVIADTYLSVSTPLAHALPTMLETRHSLQPQVLERVRTNLRWLDEQLAADLPVSRLKAEGGWYAVLRLPAVRSDEEWALELLAADGVLVHPGHFYDFATEGYLVISLLPAAEILQAGMRKLLARVLRSA
jgi:hypothetical protein